MQPQDENDLRFSPKENLEIACMDIVLLLVAHEGGHTPITLLEANENACTADVPHAALPS